MACFLTICAGAGYNMVAVLYVFVFLAAVPPLDQTIWLAAIVCNWMLNFILSPMLMVGILLIYVAAFGVRFREDPAVFHMASALIAITNCLQPQKKQRQLVAGFGRDDAPFGDPGSERTGCT
jgi:hypothetical protein